MGHNRACKTIMKSQVLILLSAAIICLLYLFNRRSTQVTKPHQRINLLVRADSPPLQSGSGILSGDGKVKDCVTGDVLGKIMKSDVRLQPIELMDESLKPEADADRQKAFGNIFEKHMWANKADETSYSGISRSGSGSTLNFAQETIAVLHTVINALKQRLGVSRVRFLDLACGDMQWMSRFLETRTDIAYTGYDIVPGIIDNHRQKFADKPWKFEQHDIVKDDIAVDKYDLIMARHVLMHLKHADVIRVLHKLSTKTSGADDYRLFLATTFCEHFPNEELDVTSSGRHRRLNLELPPMSLQPPLCLYRDGTNVNQWKNGLHYLGLWQLPLNVVADCQQVVRFNASIGTFRSCVAWPIKA